ncbi:MAG: ABC transporter permease subunit [Chloroflexota bacterium]
MDKIRTIIGKEWAEVFKNKMVLISVVLLPLVFAALPLVMLVVFNRFGPSMGNLSDPDIMEMFADQCQGLSGSDCTILYTLNLFVLLFMILPVAIPVTIAAYSVVGEKTNRSLEPLLATPITTANS